MAGNNITEIRAGAAGSASLNENVSALLDGETKHLTESEIQQLLESSESRASLSRYQLIGDVLREGSGEITTVSQSGSFATALRDKIAAEPTVIAPQATAETRKKTAKYLQPVAGLAIAASVAGIAVIGIQKMNAEPQSGVEQLSVANLNAAEQVMASTAVATADTDADTPELEIDLAEHKRRLNSYLVNFNEQRASLGMPGVNPYVRIIDFESEK
ncbi:MAG: RseA family anti-sigma factor [Pseudomonadota bacterium]